MLASLRKLEKNPKNNTDMMFIGAAVVTVESEGIPNTDYPPNEKTEVINGCKRHGHPLTNIA
jgi:hypothetical protein